MKGFQTTKNKSKIARSLQPCAIENLHLGVAKQVSVAVGWVKIKTLLMAQLKGLSAKFKLM